MKKRWISIVLSVGLIVGSVTAQASSLSSWYGQKTGNEQPRQTERSSNVDTAGQATLPIKEEKIVSPGFGGKTVGRTVIPEGWSLETTDLNIGSESITCPNAIWMTVTSPDGKCKLTYLSKRSFMEQEVYYDVGGFQSSFHSEDDKYDLEHMMHTLDYRDASGVCDLMAVILYGGNPVLEAEMEQSQEDAAYLEAWKSNYDTMIRTGLDEYQQMYGGTLEVKWTDITSAARTYRDGDKKMSVVNITNGCDIYAALNPGYSASYLNTIYWDMGCVYGLWTDADVHENYMDIFNAFIGCTTVSQEYEQMRQKNAAELQLAMWKARNEAQQDSYEEQQRRYDEIEESTIGGGETYSASDAWDDYIRGETDYTTSDGSHIKLPDSYEHVYEGDDGTIYAGSSLDGPIGSTELNPTQIGY